MRICEITEKAVKIDANNFADNNNANVARGNAQSLAVVGGANSGRQRTIADRTRRSR